MKLNFCKKPGQVLVALLVFMAVGLIITSAAVAILIATSQATLRFYLGEEVYAAAESGVENAILRLERDPSYSGEQSMIVGRGSAAITVSGDEVKTIESEATIGNFRRKIRVEGTFEDFIFTPTSWVEVN